MAWISPVNLLHIFRTTFPKSSSGQLLLCVCVCFCVWGCVFTSIHREGFIFQDQVRYLRTDQRCYFEDVNFLCQVPSPLLQNAAPNLSNQPSYPVYTLEACKVTSLNQCTSRFQNMGPSFTTQQASPSVRTTS